MSTTTLIHASQYFAVELPRPSSAIYRGYELSTCGQFADDICVLSGDDQAQLADRVFYTVYGKLADGLTDAIRDFDDYEVAERFYKHLCETLSGYVRSPYPEVTFDAELYWEADGSKPVLISSTETASTYSNLLSQAIGIVKQYREAHGFEVEFCNVAEYSTNPPETRLTDLWQVGAHHEQEGTTEHVGLLFIQKSK